MMVAQTVHAAGESARLAPELPDNTHAVVLSVPDEVSLLEIEAELLQAGIPHKTIREPDSPYGGAATCLGIMPMSRSKPLRKLLGGLPLLK